MEEPFRRANSIEDPTLALRGNYDDPGNIIAYFLFEVIYFQKKKKVAAPRFDRGTSGLWALRAIPAAPCCFRNVTHHCILVCVDAPCGVGVSHFNHSPDCDITPCSQPPKMATPEAALKLEIARLTGTFSFHTCILPS
jgi:hypothetical protein